MMGYCVEWQRPEMDAPMAWYFRYEAMAVKVAGQLAQDGPVIVTVHPLAEVPPRTHFMDREITPA